MHDDHKNCIFIHMFFYNAFFSHSFVFCSLALTSIGSIAHSVVPLLFLQLFSWMVDWFVPFLPTAAEPATQTVLTYHNDTIIAILFAAKENEDNTKVVLVSSKG